MFYIKYNDGDYLFSDDGECLLEWFTIYSNIFEFGRINSNFVSFCTPIKVKEVSCEKKNEDNE